METTIVYGGNIGIMEKKMETTIWVYIRICISIGNYWDNGKENGNHYNGVT